MGRRVSPLFSKFLGITVVLAIGPLLAIPRTGATAFEIGGGSLFSKDIEKVDLIVNIANNSLESFGKIVLGSSLAGACSNRWIYW